MLGQKEGLVEYIFSGEAHGFVVERKRSGERQTHPAVSSPQGGDPKLPQVRGEVEAHRQPGVRQERHPKGKPSSELRQIIF